MDKSPTNQIRLSQKQLQLHLQQQQQKFYMDNHEQYYPSPSASPPIPHFPPPPEYPPPSHQSSYDIQQSPASRSSNKKYHHTAPDPNRIEVCIEYQQRRNSLESLEESQPIKWNRNNIAATMEKYEPTQKHRTSSKSNTTGHPSKHHQSHLSCQQKNSSHLNQDYLNDIHQDYAYAYYEPGMPMRHQNIPGYYEEAGPSRPPPANSMRALMSIARKKTLQRNANKIYFPETESAASGSVTSRNINQENVYEEIHSDNKLRMLVDPLTKVSLNQNLVEEEFRQVQNRHQRVLGELNLSVEEMLMPTADAVVDNLDTGASYSSAPSSSSTVIELNTLNQQPQPQQRKDEAHRDLLNNHLMDYARDFVSSNGLNSSSSSCNNTSTSTNSNNNIINAAELSGGGGGDLDSGFSGSNSSYIGSLRYHKTMRSSNAMKMSPIRAPPLCNIEMGPIMAGPGGAAYLNHDHNSFCCQAVNISHLDVNDDFGMNSLSLSSRLSPTHYDGGRMCCNNGFLGGGANSHHDTSTWKKPSIFSSQFRSNCDPSLTMSPTDSKNTKPSFWKLKTWRKFPGFSSSSNISKIKSNGKCMQFFRVIVPIFTV